MKIPAPKIHTEIYYRFLNQHMIQYLAFFAKHQPNKLFKFLWEFPKKISEDDPRIAIESMIYHYKNKLSHMLEKQGATPNVNINRKTEYLFKIYRRMLVELCGKNPRLHITKPKIWCKDIMKKIETEEWKEP